MKLAKISEMKGTKQQGGSAKKGASLRASVSFPRDLCQALKSIARRKKVSLAWVVREAAEKYVEDQTPLFRGQR